MARIALDAMGGDFAPNAPVEGALMALAELDQSHSIQLVGRADVIGSTLDSLLASQYASVTSQRHRLSIVDAPEAIDMSEKPLAALRAKPNNSMTIGLTLQVKREADAFVSAGSTGAQMAASMLLLKLLPGLHRPAIATLFPTALRPVVVLDSGANVDCDARELLQFAWLGGVYAECILGRENPAIGLLSIGEEPEKGNAVVKEANALFTAADFNFHGNVEGRDLPAGGTDAGPLDVVVCDGFVGNVALKASEGLAQMIATVLRQEFRRSLWTRLAGLVALPVLKGFKARFDHRHYNGASLLGLTGIVVKSHGAADVLAFQCALKCAAEAARNRLPAKIAAGMERATAAM